MTLTQRLDLRQAQSLVMTPQLQQAIKLLQMSSHELAEYVEREIEQNPLLERDDGEPGTVDPAEPEPPEAAADASVRDTVDLTGSERMATDDGPLDTDYANVWTNDAAGEGVGPVESWSGSGGRADFGGDLPDLGETHARPATLHDHLAEQLGVEIADPADRLIGRALIDLVDEAGYLRGDLAGIAEMLDCEVGRVERVLDRLQRFDPPGVFARSLQECLALQLRERDRLDPAMQALLDRLDLLAARDVAALRRVCGVDAEDLADMVAEIRALDPKPGLAFGPVEVDVVVPDVLVRRDPAGGWIVELNPDALPRVLVNNAYHARVMGGVRSKAERDYLNERLGSANWLARALHQRATTILRVASEIVRRQDAFLRLGVQHLRPLILRDVAEAIGVHESTVSRVTTGKFVATPRGIHELKYFFTTAISGAGGHADHSAESVRYRIRDLIDRETADAVLSDDQIVEILRKEGVDIARRTVAKYREAMRIPSSVQRRREKSLGL